MLLTPLYKFRRRKAIILLELAGKMLGIFKAKTFGSLIDSDSADK